MIFDWHPAKDEATRSARGFGFAEAIGIFLGDVLAVPDARHAYGEARTLAVGQVGGTFYTVIYTDRGEVRRIISAWPSNRKERAAWLTLFG